MRIIILFLILALGLSLPAHAETSAPAPGWHSDPPPVDPAPSETPAPVPAVAPAQPPKKIKHYAEPAFVWVDDQGVEHVSKKSAIPSKYFDNFANQHPAITAKARSLRKWSVGWLVPLLSVAGGVRSAFGL